ncbi:MAG: hypothetical protein ACOYIT_01090 [Christensenellales bacterium]|jgi:uncharacterized membrane protein YoaK (UPF0700 family)
MGKHKNSENNEKSSSSLPIAMCFGIAIGTGLGAAMNNIGLWLPVGLALGVAVGAGLNSKGKE